MSISRLLGEFYRTPWAMLPDHLYMMQMVLHRWEAGIKLTSEEIKAAIGNAPEAAAGRRAADANQPGAVAVLPLFGVISHRISQVQDISGPGGTSTEGFTQMFRRAMNDPAVGAIVIDIDSPGGGVYGVKELADEIMAARGQKKVVAVANGLAASAAYWIGSAADELVVTPSGEVGSIGVYTAHQDVSKFLEERGVNMTLISAGKYKVEGNPYEPLSEEALASIQKSVDAYYDQFTSSVAKARGASVSDVRKGFGEGRVVMAKEAVSLGMADKVETMDEVLARLTQSKRAQTPKRRNANRLALAERT